MSNNNGHDASRSASSANYIFRIHNDGASDMHLKGWDRSSKLNSEKIKTIKDVLKKGASKVATSVPSPFARMHLFDTAFKMVAENPEGDSVYHQLVSDCLDMFELLFNTGNNDDNIKFKTWNRQERINKLKGAGDGHPHKLLGDSLEMFFTDRFATAQQITLIYYKGILIGGTSPLTVFFTSPNWQREMQANKIVLAGNANGDVFFDMNYCPLHKRDRNFAVFMYKFYLANRSFLLSNCEGLANYIRNTVERFAKDLFQKGSDDWEHYINTPTALDKEYDRLALSANTSNFLQIGNLYSYTVKKGDIAAMIEHESDFLIAATVDHYKLQKDATTSESVKHKPLVLVRQMNVAGTYTFNNTPWTPDIDIRRSAIMDTHGNPAPLSQRILPGNANIKYPFVTTEDFLEDTLICMPFKLNREKFFTGAAGDFEYLLPIKKEYFNFFKKEDLQRDLSIQYAVDRIIVKLKIPILSTKGNTHIVFTKEYDLSKTPVAKHPGGIAISPFYQITDPDSTLRELNEYTVLYAIDTDNEGAALSFWQYEKIATGADIPVTKPDARTYRSKSGSSYYYQVRTGFDLIELQLKDEKQRSFRGLIIPEFKKVSNREATRQFTFAIDFGTSNTHIAYVEDQNDKKPKTFEITEADMQTVSLNAPGTGGTVAERYAGGFGDFKELRTFTNKEFLPSVIGKSSNAEVYFPVRTVTAEKATFASETAQLFHNINCGFYLDLDETQVDSLKYTTNLKWRFDYSLDPADPKRIEAFMKELMLIIRNKVIMNGGNIKDTKIVWLAPLSMKQRSVEMFMKSWQKAFDEIFKTSGAALLEPVTESVAPYFFLKNNTNTGIENFEDAINVDIGGGTTDVMFFMKKSKKYLSTSFKFAGNDIWGDGYGRNDKDNGFLQHFLARYKEKKQSKGREDLIFDKFMNDSRLHSEDITSLLFRYDEYFSFSESINRDRPQLKVILFLHYSAIIYHLVQTLENEGLDIPRYFTFTGKGSQYLSLMCSANMLTPFTRLLLHAYTDLPVPEGFKVVPTESPKEATANGATLFVSSPEHATLNKETIKIVSCWGAEKEKDYSFERNETLVSEILADNEFQLSVLRNMQHFIDQTLGSKPIIAFLAEYEIKDIQAYKMFLTAGDATKGGQLRDSFYSQLEDTKQNLNDSISETYFFLPLKSALYKLSKYIITREN